MTRRQHPKDMFDRQTLAANDWFAREDLRIIGDSC